MTKYPMTKEARNIKARIGAAGLSDFGFAVSFGLGCFVIRHSLPSLFPAVSSKTIIAMTASTWTKMMTAPTVFVW